MGVMCSLLGHDYDDPEVERERDENGEELVLTAKRVQRCSSCGHERTISENTEVTALSAAAGVVREPDGTVVFAADESGVEPDDRDAPTPTGPPGTEDPDRSAAGPATPARNDGGARTTGNDPAGSDGSDGAGDADERASPAKPAEPTTTAGDGSADADDPAGRSPGPGGVIADSVTAESALRRPTDGTARAGLNGSSPDGGTSIDRIGDEPTARDSPRRAPGEWPAEPTRHRLSTTESGPSTDADGVGSAAWPGETDAESANDGGTDGTDDGNRRVTGGSFVCGSCGFDAAVIDSPHRAGDICPNCHRGYLAWETRKG